MESNIFAVFLLFIFLPDVETPFLSASQLVHRHQTTT